MTKKKKIIELSQKQIKDIIPNNTISRGKNLEKYMPYIKMFLLGAMEHLNLEIDECVKQEKNNISFDTFLELDVITKFLNLSVLFNYTIESFQNYELSFEDIAILNNAHKNLKYHAIFVTECYLREKLILKRKEIELNTEIYFSSESLDLLHQLDKRFCNEFKSNVNKFLKSKKGLIQDFLSALKIIQERQEKLSFDFYGVKVYKSFLQSYLADEYEFHNMLVREETRKAMLFKDKPNDELSPEHWGRLVVKMDEIISKAIKGTLKDDDSSYDDLLGEYTINDLLEHSDILKILREMPLEGKFFDFHMLFFDMHLMSYMKNRDVGYIIDWAVRYNIRRLGMHPELKNEFAEYIKQIKTFCGDDLPFTEDEEHLNLKPVEDAKKVITTTSQLPENLATPESMKYWKRLQENEFVDENYQRKKMTRQQTMYIAEAFAEKLGIRSKWQTFESLWNINNLAQEKKQMRETGKMPAKYKTINKIFED